MISIGAAPISQSGSALQNESSRLLPGSSLLAAAQGVFGNVGSYRTSRAVQHHTQMQPASCRLNKVGTLGTGNCGCK